MLKHSSMNDLLAQSSLKGESVIMTFPKLWLTETMANETDTSLFRTVSDGFRRFRSVSDGFELFSDGFRRFRTVFGPFRTVSGRVPAVSDDSNPNLKKNQISIGQG